MAVCSVHLISQLSRPGTLGGMNFVIQLHPTSSSTWDLRSVNHLAQDRPHSQETLWEQLHSADGQTDDDSEGS